MISRFNKSSKWYDMLAFLVLIIVICAGIQLAFPTSGLAHAIHQGFHFLALLVGWLGNGLIALAGLLNQL